MIRVIEIDETNPQQKRRFLELPFRIYSEVPQWVPPMEMDILRMLDPGKHPFYKHGRAVFFLAMDGDRPSGRLVTLVNDNYNAFNHEQTAFFYLFECENRPDAAAALFEAGEDWARRQGMNRMIGPRASRCLTASGRCRAVSTTARRLGCRTTRRTIRNCSKGLAFSAPASWFPATWTPKCSFRIRSTKWRSSS
jgi:hypothetical protein